MFFSSLKAPSHHCDPLKTFLLNTCTSGSIFSVTLTLTQFTWAEDLHTNPTHKPLPYKEEKKLHKKVWEEEENWSK